MQRQRDPKLFEQYRERQQTAAALLQAQEHPTTTADTSSGGTQHDLFNMDDLMRSPQMLDKYLSNQGSYLSAGGSAYDFSKESAELRSLLAAYYRDIGRQMPSVPGDM
jgi:hypothetical protein